MTTPKLYTAEYKGKTYNLSIGKWGKLIGRSTSFIAVRVSKADVRGHKNPIEFAIEESEKCRKTYTPVIESKRYSTSDGRKATLDEQFAKDNKDLINGFLYPSGIELQVKRENI